MKRYIKSSKPVNAGSDCCYRDRSGQKYTINDLKKQYENSPSAKAGGYSFDKWVELAQENGMLTKVISSSVKANMSFVCPKCGNKSLYCVDHDVHKPIDVDYHENFVCDECGAELLSEPQFGGKFRFVDNVESANDNNSGYWYFTRHGVQPGSVPRNILIDELIDKDGGSYFLANRVLTTDELREYEIKEKSPFDTPVEADTTEPWVREMCDELYAAGSKFLVDSGVSEGLVLRDFSVDHSEFADLVQVDIHVSSLDEYLPDIVDVLDPIVSRYDPTAYFNITREHFAYALIDAGSEDVTSAIDVASILTGILKAAEIAQTVLDIKEIVESLKQVGKEIYDKYKKIIDSGDYNPVDVAAQIIEDLQKISPEAIQ